MEHDPSPDFADGEYGVIRIPDAWHVASLACFTAALGARFLVKLMPVQWMPLPKPLMPAVAVLLLAGVGLALGVMGLKSPRTRGAARVAVFLNATVLALGGLAAGAFFYILPD
ncbi:MAG TPA: hypothetical protein VJ725_21630 [Thermoanaerobaculia bacterium]|nr:hypothetical protein [Thermoanaerobaculia bacterium]